MPLLPLEPGPRTEDITLLKTLLNDTFAAGLSLYPSGYDDAVIAAVKQYLGRFTNHPDWREGKGVGGRQWAALLSAHAAKHAGGSGGVTEARVIELIESAGLVVPAGGD